MRLQICFLAFFAIHGQLEAANILAVWPVLSRSHINVGFALFDKLAENGHTVS